ncbi:MAG: hypothetical protein IME96_01275 [Proteobacteria bacterium]|nr:hypothetical protein [Pseudomonadota bacterium]
MLKPTFITWLLIILGAITFPPSLSPNSSCWRSRTGKKRVTSSSAKGRTGATKLILVKGGGVVDQRE